MRVRRHARRRWRFGDAARRHRQSPAVADQRAVRPDHPVARHDDSERVPAVGGADGPRGGRPPDAPCELAVGDGVAVGNAAQLVPHPALERGAGGDERQVEVAAPTPEVLQQLPLRLAQGSGQGSASLPPLRIGSVRRRVGQVDALDGAVVADDPQGSDGGVEVVVGEAHADQYLMIASSSPRCSACPRDWPACATSGRHHSPSRRHQRLPAPSQMVMFTTLMSAPSLHQVPMSTLPEPKRMGAAAVP